MSKLESKKSAVTGRGRCRIIAGKWRGRVLTFDDAEGLRPTTDRIRETVFNWLQIYLTKSRCLDCFAGTGVLGFEALSRGASKVVFIERNKKTHDNLKRNARAFIKDESEVVVKHEDTLLWLESELSKKLLDTKFDVVFLDPPFRTELLKKSCFLLNESGCLAEDAIIYVEHEVENIIEVPDNWLCLKEKSSGQVTYKLFMYKNI